MEAPLGQRLGALLPVEIGLEAHADDERLDFLGAFRRGVWAWPLRQEVGQ